MKWIQSLHRLILSAVLIIVAAPVVAQDRIPWITDLRVASEVAVRQNRLVLLHFWSDDCAPCKQLERGVFNRPEFIRALTTGYIPVKINATQQPQLAEFYKVRQWPTDVIVTPEGREVQRFQSLQDPNQYIAMLDGIRAHASVGYAAPESPNATPVATRPSQETASANPYGGYAPPQSPQPGYGQAAYGQSNSNQSEQLGTTFNQGYSQNRYTNPLDQATTPQQQQLAPRYANPYGQPADTNSNTAGSRWSQPTPGYGQSDTSVQQQATPQSNEFAVPSGAGAAGSQGALPDWQQDRGAPQSRITQNQVTPGQPAQNPPAGASAPQRGYGRNDVAAQPQTSTPQPQPNSSQPQISLEGYCPVTLVHNRVWTPGDRKWGAVHEGRVYLFAGPQQQQQFLANPHIYAPLMAGYDPVRYAETGQLVPGRREFGLYIDEPGPIALFADEAALERFHANAGYYFNVIRQAKTQQAGRATR